VLKRVHAKKKMPFSDNEITEVTYLGGLGMKSAFRQVIALITLFSFIFFTSGAVPASAGEKAAPAGDPGAAVKKDYVAVMDLETPDLPKALGKALSDKVRETLVKTRKYRLIDRANMNAILTEQGFSLQECTSNECALQVGRLLTVNRMIVGTVSKVGETYSVTLQYLNVETAEVEESVSEKCANCKQEDLLDPAERVALKLAGAALFGSLMVNSNEEGARVYIDNKFVGITPLPKIENVLTGKHSVRVAKEGFTSFVKETVVNANETATVEGTIMMVKKQEPGGETNWVLWGSVIGAVVLAGAGAAVAVSSSNSGKTSSSGSASSGSATIGWE
jgi:hypothetical protein